MSNQRKKTSRIVIINQVMNQVIFWIISIKILRKNDI